MTEYRFVKEMALDVDEFERNIGRLLHDGEQYQRHGRDIQVSLDNQRLIQFSLGEMQARRIAMVSIPFCEVSCYFTGFDEDAYEAFMQRFRLHFHKGGG